MLVAECVQHLSSSHAWSWASKLAQAQVCQQSRNCYLPSIGGREGKIARDQSMSSSPTTPGRHGFWLIEEKSSAVTTLAWWKVAGVKTCHFFSIFTGCDTTFSCYQFAHVSSGWRKRLTAVFRPGELECIVEEVKTQLRKMAVTCSSQPHRLFLGIDVGRTGYITKQNLREACIRKHLPCTDDVIDCVSWNYF